MRARWLDPLRDPAVWAREHWQPRVPIVGLGSGQQVDFRRRSGALVALASALPPDERPELGDAIVLRSIGPDAARDTVAAVVSSAGQVLRAVAFVQPSPAVLSVEVPRHDAGWLRYRSGVRPDGTLDALTTDALMISVPALVDVDAEPLLLGTDTVPALRSHRRMKRGEALGVYWEVYGPSATTALEHSIWFERETPQGALRELGVRFRVATDLNVPVIVTWDEQQAGPTVRVVDAGGRAVARVVRIQTGDLPVGRYRLQVGVRRVSDGAEASRAITIEVE